MQQHHPSQGHMGGGHPPVSSATTELVQKYLDENKQLILAILDNQNHGKLNECAVFQQKLQSNLMFLAAVADAQTQQMPMHHPQPSLMSQGPSYMGHPQAQTQMTPQSMAPRNPHQFSPQEITALQHAQLQQQQQQSLALHGQHMSYQMNGVDSSMAVSNMMNSRGIPSGNTEGMQLNRGFGGEMCRSDLMTGSDMRGQPGSFNGNLMGMGKPASESASLHSKMSNEERA